MTFSDALESIKCGHKARRRGWNGKDQYICLAVDISYNTIDENSITSYHKDIGSKAILFVGTRGSQMGWLASQADMLADDWEILQVK